MSTYLITFEQLFPQGVGMPGWFEAETFETLFSNVKLTSKGLEVSGINPNDFYENHPEYGSLTFLVVCNSYDRTYLESNPNYSFVITEDEKECWDLFKTWDIFDIESEMNDIIDRVFGYKTNSELFDRAHNSQSMSIKTEDLSKLIKLN